MRLGAHMPTAGGVWKALEHGRRLGCEAIQLFVKNNMQWRGRTPSSDDVQRFAICRNGLPCVPVFGHTGYLINLAAPSSPNRDRSIQSLIHEIEIATELCIPFLVMHPGSHLGTGESAGIQNVIGALNEVLSATRLSPVRIALENTAGQGTAIAFSIKQLVAIFDGVGNPARLGLCLDTAHFFAAGYDIRQKKTWHAIVAEVQKCVGLEHVLACHLNDSKADLGSRVDRHAGIGQGKIGRDAFRHIVNEPEFRNLPACIETPKSPDLHEDIENLAILRSLRSRRAIPTATERCALPIPMAKQER
ncbi:MAG: deoxyribonuclease IV [Verrucomicrobiota bacterium]|nr:deoxyribonuclease IV [Verrucomicrobiota bacterium]